MAAMPTPDLAVPYAAPMQVKTMAQVQPMAPKKGYVMVSVAVRPMLIRGGPCRVWSDVGSLVTRRTNRIDGAIKTLKLALGHRVQNSAASAAECRPMR